MLTLQKQSGWKHKQKKGQDTWAHNAPKENGWPHRLLRLPFWHPRRDWKPRRLSFSWHRGRFLRTGWIDRQGPGCRPPPGLSRMETGEGNRDRSRSILRSDECRLPRCRSPGKGLFRKGALVSAGHYVRLPAQGGLGFLLGLEEEGEEEGGRGRSVKN